MEAEADPPPQVHDQLAVVPVVYDEHPPPPPEVVEQPPPVQHPVRPARVRGNKFRAAECIYSMEAMHQILPIGPLEWDQVLELHSVQFPGRDVNGLRRKYNTLHRKKMPIGDPHMPEEIGMAKSCKYCISQKAKLGDGTGQYDMMQEDDCADDDPEEGVPLDDPGVIVPIFAEHSPVPAVPPLGNTNNRSSASLRKNKASKKQDFFALMAMQMQNEAAQRAHEAREQAASRAQMQANRFYHSFSFTKCCGLFLKILKQI